MDPAIVLPQSSPKQASGSSVPAVIWFRVHRGPDALSCEAQLEAPGGLQIGSTNHCLTAVSSKGLDTAQVSSFHGWLAAWRRTECSLCLIYAHLSCNTSFRYCLYHKINVFQEIFKPFKLAAFAGFPFEQAKGPSLFNRYTYKPSPCTSLPADLLDPDLNHFCCYDICGIMRTSHCRAEISPCRSESNQMSTHSSSVHEQQRKANQKICFF